MADQSPVISFQSVRRSYGQKVLFDGLSLDIPMDETTALVGESGSGKSTLLMMCNGLLAPDSGSVVVMGEEATQADVVAMRRRIGYAVQGAGLFPHLTAAENVSLVARLEGWSESQVNTKLVSLFDLVGLSEEHGERFPHELSGGEQQRVALCRALMLDPPLMLLDEPFSALDPLTKTGIHDEFVRIQSLGQRSILLVTHDMGEAMKLAQHLVILKDGKVVQHGRVDEIRESPQDGYVQQLLGSTSA